MVVTGKVNVRDVREVGEEKPAIREGRKDVLVLVQLL